VFDTKLSFVIDMLILATAAGAKVFARWLNALWGCLDNLQQFGARKTFLNFGNFDFHRLAHDHEWNKYDKIIQSPDTLAAKSDVSDG